MSTTKADIIDQLKKDILPLQGFKPSLGSHNIDVDIGPINNAFPGHGFPLGAVHEFICAGQEDQAASGGFIAGILASLMRREGASLWISSSRIIFPPALKFFGVEPDKVIFIDLPTEKDVLWATEEALKCNGLAAVVSEIKDLDFTASRRLQLAVEQSRVTGFMLRRQPRNLNTTACISRWRITSLPSVWEDEMPGIGFPRWNVELLKVRNGKPGTWQVAWMNGQFHHEPGMAPVLQHLQKKTG